MQVNVSFARQLVANGLMAQAAGTKPKVVGQNVTPCLRFACRGLDLIKHKAIYFGSVTENRYDRRFLPYRAFCAALSI